MAARLFLRHIPDMANTRGRVNQTAHYYMKSRDQKKKKEEGGWGKTIGVTGVISTAVGIALGLGYNWSGYDDEFDSLPLIQQYPQRAISKVTEIKNYFNEPSDETLLPDLLPHPYQPPYTLLIELNDVLTYAHYTRNNGWRHKKRQGLDMFLEVLAQHYEIVIFTSDTGMNSMPLIEAIDPKNCVLYKLFRDSTKYKKGIHYKDLSKLNRDLSTVIMIDVNRDAVSLQPENAMIMPKWQGEDDMDLVDLADMLVVIAKNRPEDIRDLIKCYTDLEDPIGAYRMRRSEILNNESQMNLESQIKAQSKSGFSWLIGRS